MTALGRNLPTAVVSLISQEVKVTRLPYVRGEMAHLDREILSCSICLELLKDPVTAPCGHSYCLGCISVHWDKEDEKGIHSCPQCRRSFAPRPELPKNTMLAAVVEQLRKTCLQDAPADHRYAGAEDVACDVCTGRKLKALKTCLVCLVSYCAHHLQPHLECLAFAKHKLVEPSKNLRENICSHHDKLMEMFCRSDQQCICCLCCVDKHRGHNIVPAAEERREKQEKLPECLQTIQQGIQDREEEVKVLQQEVKDINLSAFEAMAHSEKVYAELISLMEKRSSDVKEQIQTLQQAEVTRVKELQNKLEQEITQLRSKGTELQQLSQTDDHCRFLHTYLSASDLTGSRLSLTHICPRHYFADVEAAVSESSRKMQELLRDTWTNISLTKVDALLSEPKTRAGFLRYSCDITLDPNTAHASLFLSKGNRRVTRFKDDQLYPDHPDRFKRFCQVLSRESLTGRCYWEVNIGDGQVRVAVAYKNISREGCLGRFGFNNKSWTLRCNEESYEFCSNRVSYPVSGPRLSTVGVYLDHSEGVLSFYNVSDTMTLLHRVQTSFTQPLYAGLTLCFSDLSAELVKLG